MNNTHQAIDPVAKDVVICDWHYERPDQSAVYFAMKGFNVITCPWRNPKNALLQTQDMLKFRASATKEMKPRFMGMMQTVWSPADAFLDEFYGRKVNEKSGENTASNCFRSMFEEIKRVSQ